LFRLLMFYWIMTFGFWPRSMRPLFAFAFLCMGAEGVELRGDDSDFSSWFARFLSPSVREMDLNLEQLRERASPLPQADPANRSDSYGFLSKRFDSAEEEFWLEVDLLEEQEIDMVALFPVMVPDFSLRGNGFPVRFKIEALSEDRKRSFVIAEEVEADYPNPISYPYVANCEDEVEGRFIRLTSLKHWRPNRRWSIALSEFMVVSEGRNIAANCSVKAIEGGAFRTPHWGLDKLTDSQTPLGPPTIPGQSPSNGFLGEHANEVNETKWVQVDLGALFEIDQIRMLPSRPNPIAGHAGIGFPSQFRVELSEEEDFNNPIVVFKTGETDFPNPGDNPVTFNVGGAIARYARCTALKLYDWEDHFSFSLGELQVYAKSENVALGKNVKASDVSPKSVSPYWSLEGLVDGYNGRAKLIELPEWLKGLDERRSLEEQIEALALQRAAKADQVVEIGVSAISAGVGFLAIGFMVTLIRNRRERRRSFESLRKQIARDLHDDIGSNLGGIALISESALEESGLSEYVREDFKRINAIATASDESMRDIVWLIRDNDGALDKLVSKLRETANSVLGDIELTFTVEPETLPKASLSLEARRHVYFAFKESLHNIRKHSEATRVRISIMIGASRRQLRFEIEDDGKGFDPSVVDSGYGLENLRMRSESLNGDCEVSSSPGKGTKVIFSASLKS
ncbi:MAG: ATP-binding protein, partial [Verrucomicrobiota bacterium]